MEEKIIEFKTNMRYRRGQDDILVGQSREFPFLIVQGKTVDELVREMMHEIEVYFNTFPQERDKALERYGKTINEPQKEEGWNQEPIEVAIHVRRR